MNIKKSKGFTLIEILLAVGFIVVFGIGMYGIYYKVKSGNMINSSVKQIFALKDGVKKFYEEKQSYTGITNTSLANTNAVPQSMYEDTNPTVFTSNLGGDVSVVTLSVGVGLDNGFRIKLDNVGKNECGKFVITAGTDFEQVTVNGTLVKNYNSTNNILNVASATQACNSSNFATILLDSISSMKNGINASGGVATAIGATTPPATPAPLIPKTIYPLVPAP